MGPGLLLSRPVFPFAEILGVYDEQTKTDTVFFARLGVMGTMRTQDRPGIGRVQLPEPLEATMDVHVVDQEIDQPVNRNANAYKEQPELGRG